MCGLSKRYVFNRAALDGGYDVVCTGHNLDDEAAVLFGNTLRWDVSAMARQFPVLEATRPGLVKKVKPLYRVAERETAAYCVLKGIDYVVEECPLVAGNTQMRHKETLNQMEEAAPGPSTASCSATWTGPPTCSRWRTWPTSPSAPAAAWSPRPPRTRPPRPSAPSAAPSPGWSPPCRW